MNHVEIQYNWNNKLSLTEDALSTSTPSLQLDSLQEEWSATKEDNLSSSHLSTLLVKIQMKESQAKIYRKQGKFIITATGDTIKMLFIG